MLRGLQVQPSGCFMLPRQCHRASGERICIAGTSCCLMKVRQGTVKEHLCYRTEQAIAGPDPAKGPVLSAPIRLVTTKVTSTAYSPLKSKPVALQLTEAQYKSCSSRGWVCSGGRKHTLSCLNAEFKKSSSEGLEIEPEVEILNNRELISLVLFF